MNAEKLAAMPEGARLAIKMTLIEELRKSRTIRPGELLSKGMTWQHDP